MGSASRAEICVHPLLSVASSKRPSGVAAELERDLVAELGDAAMAEAFGEYGPGVPHDEVDSHGDRTRAVKRALSC